MPHGRIKKNYIYIYIERERERESVMDMRMFEIFLTLCIKMMVPNGLPDNSLLFFHSAVGNIL